MSDYQEGDTVRVIPLVTTDGGLTFHPNTAGGTGSDVNVTNVSLAVTGPLTDAQLRAAPIAVSGAGGGTEYTEDAVPPADPLGGAMLARRRDALAAEVSLDGDWVLANATNKGEQYVKHVDAIAVTGTFWQATQPVSGAFFQATQPVSIAAAVTVDSELPAAAALSDTDANPTAPSVGASNMVWSSTQWERLRSGKADAASAVGLPNVEPMMWNGTNYDRQRGDTTNGLDVDVTRVSGNVAVTGPLTDTQLRASAVPVSLTSTTVTGTVTVSLASTTITGTVTTKETRSATGTNSSPAPTNVNTSILASNGNRLGATIWNEGTVTCLVKLGATASATSYTTKILSGGYYEVPFNYTGAIDGITASGTAQLRVTELT